MYRLKLKGTCMGELFITKILVTYLAKELMVYAYLFLKSYYNYFKNAVINIIMPTCTCICNGEKQYNFKHMYVEIPIK